MAEISMNTSRANLLHITHHLKKYHANNILSKEWEPRIRLTNILLQIALRVDGKHATITMCSSSMSCAIDSHVNLWLENSMGASYMLCDMVLQGRGSLQKD